MTQINKYDCAGNNVYSELSEEAAFCTFTDDVVMVRVNRWGGLAYPIPADGRLEIVAV